MMNNSDKKLPSPYFPTNFRPPTVDDSSANDAHKRGSTDSNNVNISHLDVLRGGPFEKMFEVHFRQKEKKLNKLTYQGKIYNFLERPTGWRCFVYHFSV